MFRSIAFREAVDEILVTVRPLLAADTRGDVKTLRSRLGEEAASARLLGFDTGPGYAFLAADITAGRPQTARRSLVVLNGALVTFDLLVATGAVPRRRLDAALPAEEISSIDFAGVRLASWVVLFHTESASARSAVSFEVKGDGPLKFLVTGLAPGAWDIWRNGWLEDTSAFVSPQAGALYFEGRPGSYFLRRMG